MTDITSPRNDRIKLVRALQSQAKSRRREKRLVVEGVRLLEDALDCGLTPDFVLYLEAEVAPGRPGEAVFQRVVMQGIPYLSVTEAIFKEISDVETPPGLLAVLPQPELPIPAEPGLVLVLDAMNNPGNLGSALRTAAAAGVAVVVLPPETVDPYNPKAMRGGMGAHFRVPLRQLDWAAITAQYGHLAGYVAAADGTLSIYDVDWTQPALLVIGGEAHGARDAARQIAPTAVAIPMASHTESLNASVAAGVILYEARRQRLHAR